MNFYEAWQLMREGQEIRPKNSGFSFKLLFESKQVPNPRGEIEEIRFNQRIVCTIGNTENTVIKDFMVADIDRFVLQEWEIVE